mmetsp:Transcript_110330/g.262937  ORF Transcript_110330/g.262937 Transcript_110330/m.262937 type:complete len:222 (-) Transcript_110330:808-1473(-)
MSPGTRVEAQQHRGQLQRLVLMRKGRQQVLPGLGRALQRRQLREVPSQAPVAARLHRFHLLQGRSPEGANDLVHLPPARFPREERTPQHHLGTDAAARPPVDAGAVAGGAEDQLRRSPPAGADVAAGRLVCQDLGGAEIRHFHGTGRWVQQHVLGLQVSVHDLQTVQMRQGPEQLESEAPHVRHAQGLSANLLMESLRQVLEDHAKQLGIVLVLVHETIQE